jgi:LuxR family maltose regulon positive regulatory protein
MLSIPQAKLRIPALPSDFVERPDLLAELDAGDSAELTLVCAPPGYGKTLLLTDWATRPAEVATAWLIIDSDDNDPPRLWASITAALDAHIRLPASNSAQFPLVWSAAEHTEFVAQLVDELTSLPKPIRLVLDDVDELANPEAFRGLRTFLRNRPSQLHLVLSSTFDPPLGLNRLRLSAQLHEIRADRMRFTAAESAVLLGKVGSCLTSAQVERLHRCTGGWAAGLRLAALAIAHAPDPDRFIAEFSGDERCIADYLTGEVLSQLRPATLEFLRAISIADPISSKLAEELSGCDDAGALLDSLEHDTSLLSVVGWRRDTYRLQPLLRSYLLADLHRHGRKHVCELHAVAARWWAADGDPIRALKHARGSEDTGLLAELLSEHATGLILSGARAPLRRALDDLGSRVANDPRLALVSAFNNLEAGEVAEAQNDLRNAYGSWPAHSTIDLVVLRGLVEHLGGASLGPSATTPTGDVGREDRTMARDPELQALTCFSWGAAHFGRQDLDAARTELGGALRLARRYGFDYLAMQALTLLGLVAVSVGDLRAVREMCSQATDAAADHGWQDSLWFGIATAMLAFTQLQRAESHHAECLTAQALGQGIAQTLPQLRFALEVVHGAAVCDDHDRKSGLAQMQRARAEFADRPAATVLVGTAAILEFREAMQLGHGAAARNVRGWLAERAGDCAELDVMRAWVEAAQGREPQARALLRRVLEGGTRALLPETPVEAWLLESGLCASAGERPAARQALRLALDLAERIDVVRPFGRICPSVRELLVAQQGSFGACNKFAAKAARAAFLTQNNTTKMLSERELNVLEMLPSLLSLVDIAADLTVSVNTVKSHVRSIYTKLGVNSRRDAVLVAHENGLLMMDTCRG